MVLRSIVFSWCLFRCLFRHFLLLHTLRAKYALPPVVFYVVPYKNRRRCGLVSKKTTGGSVFLALHVPLWSYTSSLYLSTNWTHNLLGAQLSWPKQLVSGGCRFRCTSNTHTYRKSSVYETDMKLLGEHSSRQQQNTSPQV